MPESHANQNPEEPIEEVLSVEYEFIPKGNHLFRQEGYFLVCRSCDIEHAVYIGPDKLLTGFDDKGQPILKERKDLENPPKPKA